jgi:hypothetical protein
MFYQYLNSFGGEVLLGNAMDDPASCQKLPLFALIAPLLA